MTMNAAGARNAGLSIIAIFCLSADAWPQSQADADRSPLNSEQISQRFGSYGIEILEASGDHRVSSLYSDEDGLAVARTFAVVEFQAAATQALSEEHEAILSGESIGEALVSRGWAVEKSNRYIGTLLSTTQIEELMRLTSTAELAVHIYALRATRIDEEHHYATIIEIHHPEYLQLSDLREIYGDVEVKTGIEPLLTLARQKMN